MYASTFKSTISSENRKQLEEEIPMYFSTIGMSMSYELSVFVKKAAVILRFAEWDNCLETEKY